MPAFFSPSFLYKFFPKFIMCLSYISLYILTEDIRGMSRHLACWSHFLLPGHCNCLYTLISFAALFWFWGNDSIIRYMSYCALECVIITHNMIPIFCTATLTACNDFWGILIIRATDEKNIKNELNVAYFFCHMGSVIVSPFYYQKWGVLFLVVFWGEYIFHAWSCVIDKQRVSWPVI